ncbi:AAA family ATPase [Vibrio splendidus]
MNLENKPSHITRVEILNWCGKERISIPFEERVTFLTGINGSGKSSMLNVIFDSLVGNPKEHQKPSTSKHRFWGSNLIFNKGVSSQTLILPYAQLEKIDKEVDELLEKRDFFDLELLKSIQAVHEYGDSDGSVSFIDFDITPKGEQWRKSISQEERFDEEIENYLTSKSLGFIFQEDRKALHNSEEISSGSPFYQYAYSSSIDSRLAFIRDAIQVRESQLNKRQLQEFRKVNEDNNILDIVNSNEFKSISKSLNEIEKVIETLNDYFKESGKCIARDDDNKITLGIIQGDESEAKLICWHLLSRGEKTLIYLFLSVYFYKDRVLAFLLDEPEISFHVNWQKNLVRDLSEIAPSNQFIIATHSPSLVMNGWLGNCLDLKGM